MITNTDADIDYYNEIVQAWNRRQAAIAKSKAVRKDKKAYAYYQRGLKYDPAQMTEIELYRRMGTAWHPHPAVTEMEAISWRVMY